MDSERSEVRGAKIIIVNSSSLPDSKSMNNTLFAATSSVQSLLIPASPPKAVVNIRGQTLIAPNSTLARAIIMGNQESVHGASYNATQTTTGSKTGVNQASNFENYSVSTITTPRSANIPGTNRQHDQQSSGSKKRISNLPALLNQNCYDTDAQKISTPDIQVSEADSASGPAPPPPPSPPNATLLGRSAPNFYTHTNSRNRPEKSHPPTQLTRPFQLSNAAEQLSTDKVRR